MTTNVETLNKIDKRADQIQKSFDDLWNWCKEHKKFDDKDFHNYLMWVEHEVSRGTSMIKVFTEECRS